MSALRRFKTKEAAAEAAAGDILERLSAARDRRGRATLAVSGGSTPKLMFEAMARASFDWSGVHIFWTDERMVPPGDPESNFTLADEALLQPAKIPAAQIHRIFGELEPPAAAERYADELRRFFELRDGDFPDFDVIHLGMGSDCHTASLFPNEPLIRDRSGLAAPVYAASRQSYRITLLPGVLLNAVRIVMLVTGADKVAAVEAVRHGELDLLAKPAQTVERSGRDVLWFVDDAAAPPPT